MDIFYRELDAKFSSILSGFCLTSLRDENNKIAKKYDCFDSEKIIDIKNDYFIYISNYLKLKKYSSVTIHDQYIMVDDNDLQSKFFIDFDYGDLQEYKIKILDKGVKCGISTSDEKYIFIVSINKKSICLLNLEKLKNKFREEQESRKLITETDSLFKSQYISFDISKIGQKPKIFNIK